MMVASTRKGLTACTVSTIPDAMGLFVTINICTVMTASHDVSVALLDLEDFSFPWTLSRPESRRARICQGKTRQEAEHSFSRLSGTRTQEMERSDAGAQQRSHSRIRSVAYRNLGEKLGPAARQSEAAPLPRDPAAKPRLRACLARLPCQL